MKNLILIALAITAFSCSKKDEPVAVVNQNILYKTTRLVDEINYNTDGKRLVSIVDGLTRTEFTYDANNSINKVLTFGQNNLRNEAIHTYDPVTSNIIKSVYKTFGSARNFTNTITYNYSTPILSYRNEEIYTQSGITSTIINTGTLEFEGKNLVKNTYSEINTTNFLTETIVYDNKNNPFSNLLGFSKIPLDSENKIITNSATNNPFKRELINSTLNINDIYTYTYNDANYPISIKLFRNGNLDNTQSREFFYK